VTGAPAARPIVLGVAGGSGSGKSTVVQGLVHRLGRDAVTVLCHDAFYRDLSHLAPDERERVNFDHPDSLETDLLVADLGRLLEGATVHVPSYDFTTHTRRPAKRAVEPAPVVIVDGVLVLAERRLRELMDLKVFVDTAPDVRLARRLRRDVVERGRNAASVLDQYETTVRPMHLALVEPSKGHADIVITEGGHNQEALDAVASRVRSLLSDRLGEAGGQRPRGKP